MVAFYCLQEMLKLSAKLLHMPFWSLDELLECRRFAGLFVLLFAIRPDARTGCCNSSNRSAQYQSVTVDRVKELFAHYGGVPRYVLQNPSVNSTASLKELLYPLHSAVEGCNIAQVTLWKLMPCGRNWLGALLRP